MRPHVPFTTFLLILSTLVLVGCGEEQGRGALPTGATTQTPLSTPTLTSSAVESVTDPASATSGTAESTRIVEPTSTTRYETLADKLELPPGMCLTSGGSIMAMPDIATLAWGSKQLVIGEVIRQHPSTPDPNHPQMPLYTLYDVRVEQNIRGNAEIVTLLLSGGSIERGCTNPDDWEPVAAGTRFLLFLREVDAFASDVDTSVFGAIGSAQGTWLIHDDGTVDATGPAFERYDGQPVAAVVAEAVQALAGTMPETLMGGQVPVIPLTEAPVRPDVSE